MKTSEMIGELEKLMKEAGDCPVYVFRRGESDCMEPAVASHGVVRDGKDEIHFILIDDGDDMDCVSEEQEGQS